MDHKMEAKYHDIDKHPSTGIILSPSEYQLATIRSLQYILKNVHFIVRSGKEEIPFK